MNSNRAPQSDEEAPVDGEQPVPQRRRRSLRSRRWLVIATMMVLALLGAGVGFVTTRDNQPKLDAARVLADEDGRDALADPLGPTTLREGSLDDYAMDRAFLVSPRDDQSFFVLFQGGNLVPARSTGQVREAVLKTITLLFGLPTVFSPGGDGAYVFRHGTSGTPTGGSLVLTEPYEDSDPRFDDIPDLYASFEVGALAFRDDGSLLAASRDEAQIEVLSMDGSRAPLLGPSSSDAPVRWDAPDGRILAMQVLEDERVVFVMDTDDGEQLFLLDGTAVSEIDTGSTNPVRGTAPNETAPDGEGQVSAIMTPLAPTPDGRVLTTGFTEDGHPMISAVDVDSGEVEVVADLEGVEPFADQPISAVAVGDDLIFLAEDRLWKKEGVFD